MSKFLKIITRLILILLVLGGAALLVPPFVGYDTIVVENPSASNLSEGTVVYVKSVDTGAIKEGEKIVRLTEDEAVNVYEVKSYDADSKTITAVKSEGAAEEELHASDTVRKLVLHVPFLGYLSLSTRSFTGLLILGGSLLILIILMIIAEVLGSEPDDREIAGGNQEDVEFFSSLNEKKTEAFDAEKKAQEMQDSVRDADEGKGVIPDSEEAEAFRIPEPEAPQDSVSHSGGKPAPDEGDLLQTDGLPNVQAALEAVLEGRQVERQEALPKELAAKTTAQVLKTGEVELAMPVRSAEEYLDKAHSEGDDPELIDDPVTGIKFVDFTDCL